MSALDREHRILVTGASGFIGRRIVAKLLEAGHRVRALVLPDETPPGKWTADVDLARGDVVDPEAMRHAVQGVSAVIHLAAVVSDWGPESLFQRVTVGGTTHVMQAAAEAGAKVVVVSSVVAYGDAVRRGRCDEDRPWGRPLGPYSRSKQAQESTAQRLAQQLQVPLTIVRPVNVYGPGSKPWVHDVVTMLRQGEPVLVGQGQQNAGLCYVDNLADALILAATRSEAEGRTYNVCDASDVTWLRYFSDLATIIGTGPPRRMAGSLATLAAYGYEAVWTLLQRQHRPPVTREALNLVGSDHHVPIDRIRHELGFVPGIAYEQGLEAVADYIRQEGL